MINEERGFMTKINCMIPSGARYIIYNLSRCGYQAYLVGGCVRDILIGRTPNDWDICTSATPEQIIHFVEYMNKIEDKCSEISNGRGVKNNIKYIPTGLQHGTITIVINGKPFEVTTFRQDGDYSDNRRPDNVTFTKNLSEDLKRRDFTINAIAYSLYEGFIDPFDGINDIKKKIIRCVGNPYDRFNEDALRIMRAIRFSAQLDFYIENKTNNAIFELSNNLDNISKERINSELCKILKSKHPENIVTSKNIICEIIPEFKPCIDFPQNNPYHCFTVDKHIGSTLLVDKSNDLIVRLALLFHDIGKPYCYQDDEDGTRHFRGHGRVSSKMTDEIMRRLKFDNNTREKVVELVHFHDATFEVGKKYVRRWLNILGEEQFRRLLLVRCADIKGQSGLNETERLEKINNIERLLNEVLEENECFSLKDLQLNGNDLIQLGFSEGKEIGVILNRLLSQVVDGVIKNEKEELIKNIKNNVI